MTPAVCAIVCSAIAILLLGWLADKSEPRTDIREAIRRDSERQIRENMKWR